MNEDQLDSVTATETPSSYEYITSAELPRFIGVPSDDQLLEDSSGEGILGGRTISDVHSRDTNELLEEGIDWEQASLVLSHLAAAASFHEDEESRIIQETRARIFGGVSYWDSKKEVRERYDIEVQLALNDMSDLPGFPSVKSRGTGARFQFHNPIKNAKMQGDANTDVETIADQTQERKIHFSVGGADVSVVINYHTYYLASAHQLLEKGNIYELTGRHLAHLVKIFDPQDFARVTAGWLQSKAAELRGELQIQPRHQEKVVFADGTTIQANGGRHIAIFTSTQQLRLFDFDLSSKSLKNIRLISGKSNVNMVLVDGAWQVEYLNEKTRIVQVPLLSPELQQLIVVCETIRENVLRGSKRVLEGTIEEIKRLSTVDFRLPITY